MKRTRLPLLWGILLFSSTAPALAQDVDFMSTIGEDEFSGFGFVIEEVGAPDGDYTFTIPTAINSSGTIVGWGGRGSAITRRVFRWEDGVFSEPLPPFTVARAYDINDYGVIVGYTPVEQYPIIPDEPVILSLPNWRRPPILTGFIVDGYSVVNLDSLGGEYTRAYAINNNGTVAGTAGLESGLDAAAIWNSDGEATELTSLDPLQSSYAYDVNDSEQVVGYYYNEFFEVDRAVLWNPDEDPEELGCPDSGTDVYSAHCIALKINNEGQILGRRVEFLCAPGEDCDPYRRFSALLWEGDDVSDLGAADDDEDILAPLALNNKGTAVGHTAAGPYRYRNGERTLLTDLVSWRDGREVLNDEELRVTDVTDNESLLLRGSRDTIYVAKPKFIRGDCNLNGMVGLGDYLSILSYAFNSEEEPELFEACDVTDNGTLGIADAGYLLRYLFYNAQEPPGPFPEPGVDPTP